MSELDQNEKSPLEHNDPVDQAPADELAQAAEELAHTAEDVPDVEEDLPEVASELDDSAEDPLKTAEEPDAAVEVVDEEALIEEKRLPKFPPWENFDDSLISEELRVAINAVGWTKPTPVQGMCLPYSMRKRDVAGFAQTGTGKTGVFLITIAENILRARKKAGSDKSVLRAIVLAPTRELALQIQDDAENLLTHLGMKSLAVFGGIDYEKQAATIREGVDVILATPGRLKDYFQKKVVDIKDLELFVCDEADRMFDMGFIEDVKYFFDKISPKTQKLLFSATTNDNVSELAFEYLELPEYISVTPESMTPEGITQTAFMVESKDKLKVLLGLFREQSPACALIFTNTKIVAEWLQYKLIHNGIEASLLTGDLPQNKRIALIKQIKEGKMKALIATDVASRGLHIAGLTHVYNFDLPDEAANYVHRIGRTARAGASGIAISLVCEDYGQNLADIQDLLGPTIPINCTWYDPEYLNIVDASGSPYKDPEFKSNSVRKGRDDKRPGGRDRDRGPRDDRPKERPQKSSGPRAEPKQRQAAHLDGKTDGKMGAKEPRKAKGAQTPAESRKRDISKRPVPSKSMHPTKIIKPKTAVMPTAIGQQSLWSLIRKFFGAMFGRK